MIDERSEAPSRRRTRSDICEFECRSSPSADRSAVWRPDCQSPRFLDPLASVGEAAPGGVSPFRRAAHGNIPARVRDIP
jgi:hypothetical protein